MGKEVRQASGGMMDTCPHGMPNPKTCVDCMEEGNIPVAKWLTVGTPFDAKFPGVCAGCKDTWEPGDSIQRWDREDRTKYTHAWGCTP